MLSFQQLWNKLEIRVLVISSLFLQIFLLAIAGFRKYVVSVRWAQTTGFKFRGPLAFIFHLLLWLAYLLADYVATVALAYLPGSEISKINGESKNHHHLLMFWAPFFILHLGGQDTITALSVEDNELWARHLLTLCSQVALAIYYYLSANLEVGALWPPAALMFAVAIFKYGERVVSLQRASMSALRSSMITKPDPGPNYAKFMQEYTSSNDAGLTATIKVEVEKHKGDLESQKLKESEVVEETKDYEKVVCKAYEFFQTFKRLFVDLILSYKNREESQKYFETLKKDDAYKLIEIELMWMYEILHSKGSIIYSYKHYGWISRVTTLVITSMALYLFASSNYTAYSRFDTSLTYVLLVGAVSLEIIAIIFMLLSFWTYASMKDCWLYKPFSKYLFCIMKKMRPMEKPRWSNRMAQYSLITYSLEDKPRWWKSIVKFLGLKDTWDNYRYTSCVKVNEDLKELVFRELKKKMNNIDDTASYRRFTEHRGQWALQRKGYYQEFGWSVEAEFDESILLWHIATHLLFHDFEMALRKAASETAARTTAGNGTGIADGTAGGTVAGTTAGNGTGIADGTAGGTAAGTTAGNGTGIADGTAGGTAAGTTASNGTGIADGTAGGTAAGTTAGNGTGIADGTAGGTAAGTTAGNGTGIADGTAGGTAAGKTAGNGTGIVDGTAGGTAAGTTAGNGTGIADGTAGGTAAGTTAGNGTSITVGTEEGTKLNLEPEISRDISNYMMFLLIVRPFMMPAGIGQIRFGDTCAEAKNFLQQQGDIKMDAAVSKILEVNTDYDPALVKGDRSKSVLFKGCMLAHDLKNEFTSKENGVLDWNKMWRLISVVWAEMLCYAASKCSGQFHAKQLSKGGELLTVVWFLMAHMGMGEQYRIEEGHARAKLIVSK